MIDDIAVARAIHVLGLVHWIGGVAVVTTVVLPRARAIADARQAVEAFEAFEARFAAQARVSILLVGLSGAYMLVKLDAWGLLTQAAGWWLDLMIAVWTLFAAMIYVIEPIFHARLHEAALRDKDRAFEVATAFHVVALTAAAAAIACGVLGAAGAL
jgi:uncharacterized membrane protein